MIKDGIGCLTVLGIHPLAHARGSVPLANQCAASEPRPSGSGLPQESPKRLSTRLPAVAGGWVDPVRLAKLYRGRRLGGARFANGARERPGAVRADDACESRRMRWAFWRPRLVVANLCGSQSIDGEKVFGGRGRR